jgi:hypothetical protein
MFPEPVPDVRVKGSEDDVHQGTAPLSSGLNGTRPADLVFYPTSAC